MPGPSVNLVEGPVGSRLLLFALPILAGNVAQSLNGAINAIWVGRYLGETALSATANANAIMFFVVGLVSGVSMAAAILIGRAMGARDTLRARRVMGTSAMFFAALSVLGSILGGWLARHLLALMHTPGASLGQAVAYLRVIFLAMPLTYLFVLVSAALRGVGDSRTPFRFLLFSVLLNIVMSPLLIFGIGALPRLGVTGAAWATLISQAFALMGLLFYMRRTRHVLWLGRRDARMFAVDLPILRVLISKGVPMGLQGALVSLAAIMMMRMVNGFGTHTAAAYGAALQLWPYVQMPAMAIGAACSSMAAQNIGAQRWSRVHSVARCGMMFNFLLTGGLIVLLILLDRWILGLFLPPDSTTLELARHLNHIAVWSFLLVGVTFVISGVVRAAGAVVPPLLIMVLSLWGIRIPLAELLMPRLGADAVWWSFPMSAACAMLLSLAYYRWGRWRKVHVLAVLANAQCGAPPAETPVPASSEALDLTRRSAS